MKRLIAITVMFLLLLTGCSSEIQEPAVCVLCDAFPRHAPCLVDLNTGELRELEILSNTPDWLAGAFSSTLSAPRRIPLISPKDMRLI